MISITLLKPTWKEARTAKLFSLENGKPVLKEPYKLGENFHYKSIEVNGLAGWHDLLAKCADIPVIRIPGTPLPDIGKEVRRKKCNFSDAGTNLLLIDADDWPVPDGFSLKTPQGIYDTVKELLVNQVGLTMLKDVACCVLLSSSFWNWKRLRAHVYFELSEKINLSVLYDWGRAYNESSPKCKIDPTLFLQVQPDFISRRECQGFIDPLPDSLRLTLHCDNLAPTINKAVLEGHMQSVISMSSAYAQAISTTGVVKNSDKLNTTWEETLKLCGTAQHGINEPAYRACAQLVQVVGNNVVQQNINYYVEKIFTLVWSSINAHGVRGDKKDREYYDKARFRNYLNTALQKQFGEGADQRVNDVAKALKAVIGGANPSILFDRDMIEAYRTIRSKDPGKWSSIRNIIKTKLRGKVTVADIDKALSSFNKTDIGSMMDQVFAQFTWIEGAIDQGMYCRKNNGKGYSLIGLDSGVRNDLYSKAIELFSDAVPPQFENSMMKVLVAKSREEGTTLFNKVVVENRCYTSLENGKNVTYFNMGIVNKEMTTCVVTEDDVRCIPSMQSPVVWLTDKTIRPAEIDYRPNLSKEEKDFSISSFIKNMRRFVTVEDSESLIDVIAWQLQALVNTGTAHLLEFTGASGDGKTVSALLTKELVDPTSSDIREGQDLHNGFYKKEDLAKILRSRHITIVDNLSNLSPSMQDLLCSIATGWKFDLRVMYTQEFIGLVIKKPLILTCLAPIITNQDLRSRSISVAVSKKKKEKIGDIYALWEQEKGGMRMGLMLLASKVIKYINTKRLIRADLNDRDMWGVAARVVIMQHLGYLKGDEKVILAQIKKRKQQRDVNEAMLSSTTSQIMAWVIADTDTFFGQDFQMTPGELFLTFQKFANENAGKQFNLGGTVVEISLRKMPTSVRTFGIRLSSIKNDITAVTGWELDRVRPGGCSMWRFSKP